MKITADCVPNVAAKLDALWCRALTVVLVWLQLCVVSAGAVAAESAGIGAEAETALERLGTR
ncbi:MAG: hypothetical protein ACE5O2_13430, partial [Armatimonadota bacterium]